MSSETPPREDLATQYLDQLPYTPYPVQEDALLAWFTAERGVLVCAPTGTGKTLIAQAALFEALHTGTVAYYTTPLIALTEQKFHEMQAAAGRWWSWRKSSSTACSTRRRSTWRASRQWSWTSSTTSPTASAASFGSCR